MRGYGLAARWQKAFAKLPGVPCPVCGQMVTIQDEPRRAHVTACDAARTATPQTAIAVQSVQDVEKAAAS